MSKVRQAKTLPATMRNPFLVGLMAKEVRARAEDLEKRQAESGVDNSMIIMIAKAFAHELEEFATGKIGTHADKL